MLRSVLPKSYQSTALQNTTSRQLEMVGIGEKSCTSMSLLSAGRLLPKAISLSLCDKIPLLVPADDHQLCFQALAEESQNSTASLTGGSDAPQ